ncbi:hypothetical protein MKD49_12265 [Herbaspirillum sp. WGmk3]|uniref:hypothetical protein n=1 Tax=Herbaspirillum sp. WGmk3 TaxID=2919925 RepID=UPI002090520A|nr:hypothetical protein [Herbaspirillum sp. WGmk3]MCO4857254.1 hypothetical protein [Herbaspirillum sp. WGmk3]
MQEPDGEKKKNVQSSASHKLGLHLLPEDIPLDFGDEDAQEEFDPKKPLDQLKLESEVRQLQRNDEELAHKLQENKENHQLRQKHAKRLFVLAILWIAILWIVLLIQGFGKFPIPSFIAGYENLEFNLSDSVLIAFMTSTTTTVVGLYGIAAYWLFRSQSKKNDKTEKNRKEKKSK